MKKLDPLPALLRAFFYEWLVEQRNASGHTVRSYRDTWRLFLRFVAQRHHRTVAQLRLEDLTGAEVGAFLQYIEKERGDSIGTRNCRLAALRSFFGLVAGREPETAEQCAEVLRIPTKRAPLHAPSYLDPPEVEAILAQPEWLPPPAGPDKREREAAPSWSECARPRRIVRLSPALGRPPSRRSCAARPDGSCVCRWNRRAPSRCIGGRRRLQRR